MTSFPAAYQTGIRGIIHKATEGIHYVDKTYRVRRPQAEKAGLLWGAYHFFRKAPIEQQVDFFIHNAEPNDQTLMALDHEDSACSADDARLFMELLEKKLGREAVIYSGNLLKEQLGSQEIPFWSARRLWLAQYGPSPVCQASWSQCWLWQYTGDGTGPSPQDIPGLGTNLDVNSFLGSAEDLAKSWAGRKSGEPLPDLGQAMSTAEAVWVQATLNLIEKVGLKADGQLGPASKEAIRNYQSDHQIKPTGFADEATVNEMIGDLEQWNANR